MESELKLQPPMLFKGIVLFTPGGDLVYCVDPHKQSHWHLQLCVALQEALGLLEPPHFLVPCYTATIDRWLDPQTQQLHLSAEASPLVLRHQALLNALFETDNLSWSIAPCPEGLCDSSVMLTYHPQFPQLWEDHDLVIRFEKNTPYLRSQRVESSTLSWSPMSQGRSPQGYVLRLFVNGHSAATERILHDLHQLLEKFLQQPYTLKVVDIYKHPELAEADHVTATPTLVKVYPRPVRRIAGNLDSVERILRVLSSPDL